MFDRIAVSIIIPVYNAKSYIKNCLDILLKQNFKEKFEIIMVDDASTDNSFEIIQSFKISNLKLIKLIKNSGQSVARNKGLEKAEGEYVYFMDVDDEIDKDSLKILYALAKENNIDLIFSDFKRIVNNRNQRKYTYNYEENKIFNRNDLLENMQKEIHNPSLGHLGLFGCNGRLIKNSIIKKNKIKFIEELRYFEDKTFGWDLFGKIKSAQYIRKQLYSYYVYPNVSSAVSKSISLGFKVNYFKLVAKSIRNGFLDFKLSNDKIEKLVDQGLIFYIITLLVSYSRSLVLGKIKDGNGKKIRRHLIKEILKDDEIVKAAKTYSPSPQESKWIPRAIAFKSRFFLELACDLRAKEVVKKRSAGKE